LIKKKEGGKRRRGKKRAKRGGGRRGNRGLNPGGEEGEKKLGGGIIQELKPRKMKAFSQQASRMDFLKRSWLSRLMGVHIIGWGARRKIKKGRGREEGDRTV